MLSIEELGEELEELLDNLMHINDKFKEIKALGDEEEIKEYKEIILYYVDLITSVYYKMCVLNERL